MHKPVVLFGPPGVGKSTRVRQAGLRGIDLENNWPSLPDILHLRTYAVIGAAGHPVSAFPPDQFTRILLLPSRAVYDERRRIRDAAQPNKAKQPDVYDEFARSKDEYDLVDTG
jgi:hypothetical protein